MEPQAEFKKGLSRPGKPSDSTSVDFSLLEVLKISRFLHMPGDSFSHLPNKAAGNPSLLISGGSRQREMFQFYPQV